MSVEPAQYRNSLMALERRNLQLHALPRVRPGRLRRLLSHALQPRKRRVERRRRQAIQFQMAWNQTEDEWLETLMHDLGEKRIAVYTCILDDYDELQEPSFWHTNIDYYLFSDRDTVSRIWTQRTIPDQVLALKDPFLINRYLKFHPAELFPDHAYALYLDGNMEVASDLTGLINKLGPSGLALHSHCQRKCVYMEGQAVLASTKGNTEKVEQQLDRYREEGMPVDFGLAEATVILSAVGSPLARQIFELWWAEFLSSGSLRDQLAFPYVIWKNQFDLQAITSLGKNLRLSAKFFKHSHRNN